MKLSFEITGLKAPTTNHTHTQAKNRKTGKFFPKKTTLYEQFQSMFVNKLRNQRPNVNKLNKYFDPKKHCLHVEYLFYFPIETKKGDLSLTAKDTDNMVKPTQDTLFLNLIFDDAYVTRVESEKIQSETPRIVINVKVIDYK